MHLVTVSLVSAFSNIKPNLLNARIIQTYVNRQMVDIDDKKVTKVTNKQQKVCVMNAIKG